MVGAMMHPMAVVAHAAAVGLAPLAAAAVAEGPPASLVVPTVIRTAVAVVVWAVQASLVPRVVRAVLAQTHTQHGRLLRLPV